MGPNNSQIIFNIIVSFVCVGRGGGMGADRIIHYVFNTRI